MKTFCRAILLVLLLTTGSVLPARAGSEVVIVQSSNLRPYAEARLGVENVLLSGTGGLHRKSIFPASLSTIVLSEEAAPDRRRRELARGRPDLLIAIGSRALAFAQQVPGVPMIYLMVPFPAEMLTELERATGVGLNVAPAEQFARVRELFPESRKIGVLYDPARTATLVAEARYGAADHGFELIALEAFDPKAVAQLLETLAGEIDLLWMVPDRTILTPQTLDLQALFSMKYRIPLLAFSEKYLERGAAVSIAADPGAMGAQAGRMATEILSGQPAAAIAPEAAARAVVRINRTVLTKMEKLATRQPGSSRENLQ